MQLITALLLLAAGHAVRAANDAQCAALGDAARADVCARDADFYTFDGEDNCGAAFDRTHGADAACLTRLTNDATAAAFCGVDGALDAKPLGSRDSPVSCVEAQIFESVEATCDETTKGVEFEEGALVEQGADSVPCCPTSTHPDAFLALETTTQTGGFALAAQVFCAIVSVSLHGGSTPSRFLIEALKHAGFHDVLRRGWSPSYDQCPFLAISTSGV